MKTIKLCAFAVSTTLSLVAPLLEPTKSEETSQEEAVETPDSLSQVVIENPYVCYEEIEALLSDCSWQEELKTPHPDNELYDTNTKQIRWDQVLETIKRNSQLYLEAHPEQTYLTCFTDQELREILSTHQIFINQMNQEYHLNYEQIACLIQNQEILKDTRLAALEVPYFAIYEASTQTMIFLEDSDLEYYEITKAHEEAHLLQGSCIHTVEGKTKQSVWEEPIQYVKQGIPSPLRTISLDEYIASIQSQKINPEYFIDLPEYPLLSLLELSFLPNPGYEYQDTLTEFSFHQNQEGFYQLFYGNQEGKEVEIHKLMHTIDLCYGYFLEERETIPCETEELIRLSLLEINRNLFQNLIDCETAYRPEDCIFLISLGKQFSLSILDTYLIESEYEETETIRKKYLEDYERLEEACFQELREKYKNPELFLEYQINPSDPFSIPTSEHNQAFLQTLIQQIEEFSSDQTEKSLNRSFAS